MASVRKAVHLAGARLQGKLKARMDELWADPAFRARLDDETKDVDKRNFGKFVEMAVDKSEDERNGA